MGLLDFFNKKEVVTKSNVPTDGNNALYKALYNMLTRNLTDFYDQEVDTYVNKGYAFNPHAYTVINFIARSISQVPFKVYEIKDKKQIQNYLESKSQNDYAAQNYYKEKSLEQVTKGGLVNLMKQPNENQGMAEFLFETIGYKKLTGNRYVYGLSPSGVKEGLYTKLYNMPSQLIEIVQGDWMQPVSAYKLTITENRELEIPSNQVLHQKEWNPMYDSTGLSLYGMSPMQPLLRSLQRSNESYDASLALMQNGVPAGIMSNNSDLIMTPEQLDQLEAAYKKKFGGGANKNKILFSASQVSWQEIGMKSKDMEILESNMADLRDFCRVYAIPTMLVSDTENSTFNNVTEAKKSVWMENFIPELEQIRDGFNRWLVPAWNAFDNKNYFIDYDLTKVPVLQVDLDKLSARLMKEMEQGMWSPNEVRAMLGKETGSATHLNKYMLGSRFEFVSADGTKESQSNNNDINKIEDER
jgi:HK97 family phage portal protein